MTEPKKHGGARPGAGRKSTFDVKWLLRLSKEQRAKVKALGGAEWLRGVIDRAEEPKPWA